MSEAALERIADALEKMASDPEIEIEGGPPVCPGCGKMNPEVIISATDTARGPLVKAVIEATCTECGSNMIVVPESYSMHQTRATAVQEIEAKAASFND